MATVEDEDDYMSESWLTRATDVRPGVAVTQRDARERRVEAARRLANERNHSRQNVRLLEQQSRDTALAKPVSSDTKGFAMLAKMGYKPGMAIGKNRQDALTEPLGIDLKTDRTGLGHQTELKRQSEQRVQLYCQVAAKRSRMQDELMGDYRTSKRDLAAQKKLRADMAKSRKTCRELDSRVGLHAPSVAWFWPADPAADPDPDAADAADADVFEADTVDCLVQLVAYLRLTHRYCLWCGQQFDSDHSLAADCPGPAKTDHDDTEL